MQLLGEDTATIDEECERINMGSGLSHFAFEGPRDSSVSFYARSGGSGRASSGMSVKELSSSHPRGWKKALAGGREMTEEVSGAWCPHMHTLASRWLWRHLLSPCLLSHTVCTMTDSPLGRQRQSLTDRDRDGQSDRAREQASERGLS